MHAPKTTSVWFYTNSRRLPVCRLDNQYVGWIENFHVETCIDRVDPHFQTSPFHFGDRFRCVFRSPVEKC